MHIDNLKFFRGGGLDRDNAPEYVAPVDFTDAYNVRVVGTTGSEYGYITNPESNTLIAGTRHAGINKGIGGRSFEDIRQIVTFIYNSAGYHQLTVYDADTATQKTIYTDKADSGGIQLLTLDPQYYVNCILINETYLIWADGKNEVGYTNLKTLSSGAYGTVLAEDLSLLKPQLLIPITGVYGKDNGKASNFVKGKLFQFTAQGINADFNYYTWSTWSKRIIPPQESTPLVGTDVSENNCIIVSVNIGSIRTQQLNIACRYGTFDFNTIKTVDRTYIVALTNTSVSIDSAVYEAYDPATNIYSFAFYNESLNIPVAPTETDQFVDYIWPATALEKINGNIAALANLQVGYERPVTDVTLKAVGYDPNLTVPSAILTDPLTASVVYSGGEGSGSNKPRRRMQINYTGTPHTNDIITIITNSAVDATDITTYNYTVPSGQDGNLLAVVNSVSALLSGAVAADMGGYTITFYEDPRPHRRIQTASVTLFNAGATVSKSIHALLDNSSYQLALSYRDKFGRPFPLETNNQFIVTTPSFAQLNGLTPQVTWAINAPIAPVGAVDYQWLITPNTTATNVLDVMGNLLSYIGTWDAANNTPTLAAGTGTVGDTYQITTPSLASSNRNLGNGQLEFKTGDYVVYNGQSWDIVPKSFGDLTSGGDVLAMKINPLSLFNQRYTNNGLNTILTYDFVAGDRCTLHYYFTPGSFGSKTYINSPCVDVDVFGYDPTTYLVKIQKSSSISTGTLAGKDIFLRLYTPNVQVAGSAVTTDNTTIWYEIAERFTITNGNHDTLTGNITDGDVYFKTRSYNGAIDPNASYNVLATDFNFSDFYLSNYTSYGRPRAYYDILEKSVQKATIITSQNYVLGSKKNGLNRFYAENQYGENDGQTSSSYGGIYVLWQRGDILEVFQELRLGSVPVNRSITEDLIQQKQYAISQKLLNTIRYSQTAGVGIGTCKESFCFKDNNAYFIDPHRSEPFRYGLDGLQPISSKMSKYFKATLQLAYAQGKKLVMYYNMFYDEVMLCIQADGGILTIFPFNDTYWAPNEPYTIGIGDITGVTVGAGATVVNNGDGTATFTPTPGYVGSNVGVVSFNNGGTALTKNICLLWTAGDDVPNSFSFTPLFNQPLSSVVYSNSITVNGITIASPISITGGQYSVNGGAYTSASGMVNNTDNVQVRQTTSSSNSTTTITTLTIGGVSAGFNATTVASGGSDNFFVNNDSNNDIAFVHYSGPTTGTTSSVAAHTNISFTVPAGTYDVNLKLLTGPGATVDINGTSVTIAGGGNASALGVTAPIFVSLYP